MFSAFLLIMLSFTPQGTVSNSHVQGSVVQVQDDVFQVRTIDEAVSSQPLPYTLSVQPVHNPVLVQ